MRKRVNASSVRTAPAAQRKRRKRKPKVDVVGIGSHSRSKRRWSGWRGLYSDISQLHGPVVVTRSNAG